MPPVQLSPVAATILVASYIVMMVIFVVILAAIAYVLLKLNATLQAYQAKLDPLLDDAQKIMTLANEKLNSIGDKTEAILIQGENTAEVVYDRVEKTATMVQRTVNAPLIGLNALSAGLTRALRTFGSLQRQRIVTSEGLDGSGNPIVVTETDPSNWIETTEFGTAHNGERLRAKV